MISETDATSPSLNSSWMERGGDAIIRAIHAFT